MPSTADLEISEHEAWFARYVSLHQTGVEQIDGPLHLKFTHSLKVLDNAREIVRNEPEGTFSPVTGRATLLAALYHDVARFPQFRRWRTFADALSTNHAVLGCRILNQLRPLDVETREVRNLCQGAVMLHNRLHLPDRLKPGYFTVATAVRDCDRLDIIRIMGALLVKDPAANSPTEETAVLHLPEKENAFSPAIYRAVIEGRMARYEDLRCRNDFRLLMCTWVNSLHFSTARKLFRTAGLLKPLLDNLPAVPEMERVREIVTARACEMPL